MDVTAGSTKVVRIPTTDDIQLNQLGIGTSPAAPIHILNNSGAGLRIERAAATARSWEFNVSSTGNLILRDQTAAADHCQWSSAGQVQFTNGTAALPSITFAGSTTTGFYQFAATQIGIAFNGVSAGHFQRASDAASTGLVYKSLAGAGITIFTVRRNSIAATGDVLFSVESNDGGSIPMQVLGEVLDAKMTLRLSGNISPAALAASQNDYNPTSLSTSSVIRQDAAAAVNITGLAGGADGRVIQIINISTTAANTITLTHENIASLAANRFNFRSASNIVIPARGSVTLIYDSTSSRWRARSESIDTAPSDAAYLTNGAVASLSNEVNVQSYTAPLFFQNAANSTTSFEVRNAAGLAMLRVDTTNGQLLGPDGLSGAAGIGFRADATVGMYRAGANSLGLTAGVSRLVLGTAATWTVTHASADGGAGSSAAYGFSAQVNTGMYRIASPEALGWSLAGSEKMRLSGTGLGVGVVPSDTLSLKTHTLFAGSETSWRTGGVSTTGAVTASIVSKTLTADSLWTFIVRAQARRTDAGFVTDGKSFVRKFAARKVGVGAPTVSSVDTLGTDQTFGTTIATVNIVVSGDGIVVQADTTGAAAGQVLVWTATMEYQPAIGSA